MAEELTCMWGENYTDGKNELRTINVLLMGNKGTELTLSNYSQSLHEQEIHDGDFYVIYIIIRGDDLETYCD